MGALIGFFTDYQQNLWLDQFLSKVAYTPPATLYLGLLTTRVTRLGITEVPSTQTLNGFTDFTVDGTEKTRITSASHPFDAADRSVVVTGGAGWTPATYTIGSLTGGAANLSAAPAAAGAAGGTGNIIRSTGYARVALPPGTFDAAVLGRTQNRVPIVLPAPTGAWGTIQALGIFDAPTGGNLLAHISTTAPAVISAGDAPRTLAAGALTISRT